MAGVDILYLKNVLLKFLDAAAAGRSDQVPPPCCRAASRTRPQSAQATTRACGGGRGQRADLRPHPCRLAASRGSCGSLPGRAGQQCQALHPCSAVPCAVRLRD